MSWFVKVGNYVKCVEDNFPYYCRVDSINENNPNWIGIEKMRGGEKKTVNARDLRYIQTEQEHLESVGFEQKEIGNTGFWVMKDIKISSIYIDSEHLKILSGFRAVDSYEPWANIQDYFPNGVFDSESFDRDFKELNEFNEFIGFIRERGIGITEVLEALEKKQLP